jgi:phenylalanyl-tRNA synthetase beta chain
VRVPISWLRDFAALPNDAQAIADRLAMLGFPVAGIEQRPPIVGVVTGRIAALEKHPNADRLQVAHVDVGDRVLTIATAADNVAAGQTIAVATIGAALPGGLRIERRTMRGVASEGMMISADELALPPEWFEDGILQLDASTPLGADAVALFGLDGAVLDVEITANRPDAMSIIGLARELAASYDTALNLPRLSNPVTSSDMPSPEVRIESADCHRFIAQRFEGLRVEPAPAWMRVRLALAGQRPINNIVDISNYVMLETGQPLHFYDGAKLEGPALIVRDARAGEKLATLDGAERNLTPQALLIADAAKALGLAGIMGGASSEVSDDTTTIVLEAANFSGTRVRRTSTALALRTEASSRHEKSLAPALADVGAARAAELLIGLGARASAPGAFGPDLQLPPPIALRAADVERTLGLAIPAPRIARHLTSLGCTIEAQETGTMRVTAPPWRTDITVPVDLIEEVARIEGYDRIESAVPSVAPHEISSAEFESERHTAHELAALGYREVITYSLRGAEDDGLLARGGSSGSVPVEVRNPLSEEQRFLRDSLLPGLLRYFAEHPAARVFEIGDLFRLERRNIVETKALAFGFVSSEAARERWQDEAFLRIKGDAEALLQRLTGRVADASRGTEFAFHPGKTARLSIDSRDVGAVGCVDPRVSAAFGVQGGAYLCLIAPAALPSYEIPRYRPPSKFPSTYRDLAVVVDRELSAKEIQRAVGNALGTICTEARVFDEYRGPQVAEGKKSVALRITLQRFDATLTDEEADAAIASVVHALKTEFGATVRT